MGNNSVSCISVPVKKIKFILYLKWKKLRLHSTNNGNDKTYESNDETKPYKSESEIYTMLHTAITFNKDMNRCINSKYDIAKYIEEIELWNDEIEHFISYLLSM